MHPPRRLPLGRWLTVLALAAASAAYAEATADAKTDAEVAETTSQYVTTRDGTKLAVDVHLPAERATDAKLPALIELTRYWRSGEDPATGEPRRGLRELDKLFLDHGYALVKVDLRGSGASFGTRPVEYGPQEVKDGWDVVEWIVTQPWSDGKVGAYGTSYSGTTAEMLTAVQHPAVKAVIPGWSDFDDYASPTRPYGLLTEAMTRQWGAFVGALDRNDAAEIGAVVRRVDADADGALRAAAVAEHRANPDVYEAMARGHFRDDELAAGLTHDDLSPRAWKREIEASGVPMLVLVSWLDAGTVDGALVRFQHFRNPQKVVIMASSHGGRHHASPYRVSGEPLPVPSVEEQQQMRLDFFDHYLKGAANGVEAWPALRYYNLGEEAFHETSEWPPAGVQTRPYYLREDGLLASEPPTEEGGTDRYQVDFTVTTGPANRWMTQLGNPILHLDDRAAMDARMLTYTTPPLTADLQVTGTPVLYLRLASDHADGAVLAYLEDVDPSGRSRYLTEGGLRLIHRKVTKNPDWRQTTPYHSFNRADAAPMPDGAVEVAFELWPTSVLIRRGHRLRLAIAGADADSFARIPPETTPTLTVHRGSDSPSRLDLPVVEAPPAP